MERRNSNGALPLPAPGIRGMTLVECLVFLAIWVVVSGATILSMRESALLRGQMSQRAQLAAIAQSELERTRAIPTAQLQAGQFLRTREDWPTGTSCTVTLTRRSPAVWQVDVAVERQTARTIKPVTLTTIIRAAL